MRFSGMFRMYFAPSQRTSGSKYANHPHYRCLCRAQTQRRRTTTSSFITQGGQRGPCPLLVEMGVLVADARGVVGAVAALDVGVADVIALRRAAVLLRRSLALSRLLLPLLPSSRSRSRTTRRLHSNNTGRRLFGLAPSGANGGNGGNFDRGVVVRIVRVRALGHNEAGLVDVVPDVVAPCVQLAQQLGLDDAVLLVVLARHLQKTTTR